ncbi:MAG: hypothetical protein MZV63_65105 [Marinilabiliales bacterium]|nr:hypothetical protein [Marinilabiliales bacterium]
MDHEGPLDLTEQGPVEGPGVGLDGFGVFRPFEFARAARRRRRAGRRPRSARRATG